MTNLKALVGRMQPGALDLKGRLGLGLIGVGLTALSPMGIELLISFIALLRDRDAPFPSGPTTITAIVGVVILGTGVLIVFRTIRQIEAKQEAHEREQLELRQPSLTVERNRGWPVRTQERRKVIIQVPLLLRAGTLDVTVTAIEVDRFVAGCPTQLARPKLMRDGTHEVWAAFSTDNINLREPVKLSAGQAIVVWYEATSIAPAELENLNSDQSEYSIKVHMFLADGERKVLEAFVSNPQEGGFRAIDRISDPPWLSDRVVDAAKRAGIISREDAELAREWDQYERYRILRSGKLLGEPAPELVDQLEGIRAKVNEWDAKTSRAMLSHPKRLIQILTRRMSGS